MTLALSGGRGAGRGGGGGFPRQFREGTGRGRH